MAGKRSPGALAGATGAGLTFKATTLNVTRSYSTFNGEMHQDLRHARLRARHGLPAVIARPSLGVPLDDFDKAEHDRLEYKTANAERIDIEEKQE